MLREVGIIDLLLKVFISILAGGLLGLERGIKSRPAGFRTYILVCLGSCLVMMTNQYVFLAYNTSDPVRLGAQVISGIGFLGAGTIIVTGKNQIKGITTAAGLWTSACCGLAIGIGFYEGALIGTVAIYLVMTVMQRIDYLIHQRAKYMDLYIELKPESSFGQFLQYLRDEQFDINTIQINQNRSERNNVLCAILTVKTKMRRTHTEMRKIIEEYSNLVFLEELEN